MLGAIVGDIICSIYELDPIKTKNFPLFGVGTDFTDDTVCTVAAADCILQGVISRPSSRTTAGAIRIAATAAGLPTG